MSTFTYDDLFRIMRACAGEDDSAVLGADAVDTNFEELGYDSLALLETASLISREYGVDLPESAVTEARTPQELVEIVNANAPQPV